MASSTVESMVSELDIFAPPVIQTSVLSGDWQYFKPVQTISQDGPITFMVPGNGEAYIDMAKTLLYVRMKVVDSATNAAIANDKNYTVVNNTLNSLFSDIKVEFNQTTVSSASSMNHYRSYLENLFNYNDTAKTSHLTSSLYYMDEAGKFDDVTSAPNAKRKTFVVAGKEVELVGRLHCDVLNSGKYLLNNVDLRITLTRNPASLVVLSPDDISPKIVIEDISLLCRKVVCHPSIMLSHAALLNSTTAKYPYKRVEMLNFTLSSGIYQKSLENLFLNKIPNRIIFGLCSNSAFSGALKENCFNFQHYNVSQICLTVNGTIVGSSPYKLNYGNDNYMLPYIFS